MSCAVAARAARPLHGPRRGSVFLERKWKHLNIFGIDCWIYLAFLCLSEGDSGSAPLPRSSVLSEVENSQLAHDHCALPGCAVARLWGLRATGTADWGSRAARPRGPCPRGACVRAVSGRAAPAARAAPRRTCRAVPSLASAEVTSKFNKQLPQLTTHQHGGTGHWHAQVTANLRARAARTPQQRSASSNPHAMSHPGLRLARPSACVCVARPYHSCALPPHPATRCASDADVRVRRRRTTHPSA